MSSLRNSLHRRNHKERSQLSHRAKFGILEKHKDYVLRARDYHSKQDRIQRLRQKAADRNKDEFYYGMTHQRTQGGVHVQDRGNVALPLDMVKVLKTQDENYIRTMRTSNLKKIERLKAQLTQLADLIAPHFEKTANDDDDDDDDDELDEGELDILQRAGIIPSGMKSKGKSKRSTKHIIFAGNEKAREHTTVDGSEGDAQITGAPDFEPVDLGWADTSLPKAPEKRKLKEAKEVDEESLMEQKADAQKHRTRLLKELSARLERNTQLQYAERELLMQRALMGKGGKMKLRGVERIGGDEEEMDEDEMDSMRTKKFGKNRTKEEKVYKPRVYKWRFERKK